MNTTSAQERVQEEPRQRLRVLIRGAVQGVGFRPFVYRLATELGLAGWVNNSGQGVLVEVEGPPARLERFLARLDREKPPRAFSQSQEHVLLDPVGYSTFEIRESDTSGEKTALVLPDIATCSDCLREIFDPADRRYRYPFTNCTNCGPRFSIIDALPYDRPSTTMRDFVMCERCRTEYENPVDRRFHAQPIACSTCGPHLELWGGSGRVVASHDAALIGAAEAIRRGAIVAVKGLGGFHLMVDARNQEAVRRLRQRKGREEKPFALMYPSLDAVQAHCEISEIEERLLRSPEAPIVLLKKKNPAIASDVAPGNPLLGVMLPYTPLHHLLMHELGVPVVATSGNLSDEPICTDEREALRRLGPIADLFLIHNRPIARHVDDSVVRVVAGRVQVVRRARGYAPLPITLRSSLPPLLAVGAHLKNTVAVTSRNDVFISQHIGDLETLQAFDAFRRVIGSLTHLHELSPAAVVSDAHPDYLSTRFAEASGLPVVKVQHHHAHIMACLAENDLEGPVLGVAWDGTGYGPDGTVWGGEFLRVDGASWARVAHFRTFRLPGGESAIREPRRAALGLLSEVLGDELFARTDLAPVAAFSPSELHGLRTMLQRGLNAPVTSSAGRLFDSVAALMGLRQRNSFEGQAAMELEYALEGIETDEHYPFEIVPVQHAPTVVDWEPLVRAILDDLAQGTPAGFISARFHNTLAEIVVAIAHEVGVERVALAGGCFQNRYLTERAVRRLREEGFRPYWHQRVPPNDGSIALGQTFAAALRLEKE